MVPPTFTKPSTSSPSADNLENLLLNIAQNYTPALKGVDFAAAEPELFPDVGLWHPLAPRMYEDLKEYLNWCAEAAEAVLAPALLVLLRCVVASGPRVLLQHLGRRDRRSAGQACVWERPWA